MNAPLRISPSVCPHDCTSTCALEVEIKDARTIGRVRGSMRNTYTNGVICEKVARYAERVHHPDRLKYPMKRTGPKGSKQFTRISWEEALDTVAEQFQKKAAQHGTESVWPYFYAGTMGHVQGWTMGPRLFAHLGASRLRTTICTAAATAALRSIYGASVGFEPETIVEARLILLWGGNLLRVWREAENVARRLQAGAR